MGRLTGKVAVITGAARGIGEAAARLFVREGAKAMLADMREDELRALARDIGPNAAAQAADVSNDDAMRRLFEATVATFGKVDVAVLNAGIAGRPSPIPDYPTELFDQIMAVNVRGIWLGLKHAMTAMQPHGGSIVITASTAGIRATPNMAPYTASKHAAIGLMRAAAIEGADKNIRVNTVNPATIDTPMVRELNELSARKGTREARSVPMGRSGTADEVANMMLFLASDEASFCTGGVYMVDGGVTAGRTN